MKVTELSKDNAIQFYMSASPSKQAMILYNALDYMVEFKDKYKAIEAAVLAMYLKTEN